MRQPDEALARLLQSIEADRRGLFARLGDFDETDSRFAIPLEEAADV